MCIVSASSLAERRYYWSRRVDRFEQGVTVLWWWTSDIYNNFVCVCKSFNKKKILTELSNDFTTEVSTFHPLSISGPAVASFLLAIAQCDQLLW